MFRAFYPYLALFLQFIYLPAIYITRSDALAAKLQYQNATNATTIGQSLDNLMDMLSAETDIFYRNSEMVECSIAVDHGDHDPEEFHERPWSSNISEFRDMRCAFRNGGPVLDARLALFALENRWPLHWDQWKRPGPNFTNYYEVFPFSGRKALNYMSAERADRLLKAHGHTGCYQVVTLGKITAQGNESWRFTNVLVPDSEGGGQRTFVVDVRTGQISLFVWPRTGQKNLGELTSVTAVPAAGDQ
ncbi:hypothetical protein BDR22DRAFT_826229 [Usnea florida]